VAFALGSVTGNGGMTVSKVGKKLRLPSRAVYFLIGEKDGAGEPFLRSCGQVRHMGVMRPLVDPDEVENFSSKYRKLIEIVDYKSRNLPRVREELRSKGIFPVWDSGDVGAEIYRISDL
jgi:hypothetical protein